MSDADRDRGVVNPTRIRADGNPRVLLVKTSSLGDVIHNLPVASDLRHHFPNAEIHWLVEEQYMAERG